jgi:hypothetical protein
MNDVVRFDNVKECEITRIGITKKFKLNQLSPKDEVVKDACPVAHRAFTGL